MQKSLLNLYLQKVAEGDESYVEKLCAQLSDRLVVVPTVQEAAPTNDGSGSTRVRVLRLKEEHRVVVPAFTSEKRFKAWSAEKSHLGGSISLFSGDLCAALDGQTWVLVDPGFDASVQLAPHMVKKVAESGLDDGMAPAPTPSSEQLRRPEIPGTAVPNQGSENIASSSGTEIVSSAGQPQAPVSELPQLDVRYGKSVIELSAEESIPTPEVKPAPPRLPSQTNMRSPRGSSPNLTAPPDDGSNKRKSFLSFLKGS